MAPISDKRPLAQPQAHGKESSHGHAHSHGHGGHNHTKENASSKHTKRGLEILDFHESWLEEMELYKDKLYVQKHNNHHQQQMLGTHNHAHTPQCCPTEIFNTANNNSNNNNTNSNNMMSVNKNQSTMNATTNSLDIANGNNSKRKVVSEHNNISKPRVVVRNQNAVAATNAAAGASASIAAAATALASTDAFKAANGNVQRPREDLPAGNNSNSKRHAHSHTHTHPPLHVHPNPTPQKSGTGGGNAPNAAPTGANQSSKAATKIIVNQFHASSLLNQHHHDEKTKILTQNGLTKSAATAYETSLYASHYLTNDNRNGLNAFHNARSSFGEYTNYVGVSLAKHGDERHRDLVEDDPCAAIDDVNDYTDTDSDEEYTGHPFYLSEDGSETYQSRNIRYQAEQIFSTSEESEADHTEYYRPKAILSPSIFPNVPPYLNFSSHAEKGPSMPATLHKVLKWKLSPVMPKIVKRVVLNSGFRIIKNTTDWMAIWEKHMKSPGFRTIRSHQKYNHMPGSFRIGRKDTMWRSIYNNMKKFGTKEFGFMQKSYVMPDDLESLRQVWPKNASKLTKWIVKPPASARGTGIRIVNKWSQFPKDRPLVVQKYIERPLLINDNKFDMRIYVVVTSINPLRIYMYKDGLARFASVKYSSELNSLDDRCMHLTNYSINKFSQNYSKNEDYNACQGHKWTLQSLWSCLETRGVNTKRLWATLRNLVIKAIISGESGLNRMYRQNVNFRYNCFELFGFDVLLDDNLIPWLLEINISPSLHSELPLDLHVKGPLIQAVLNTALYQVPPKLGEKQQREILDELKLDGPLCHDKRIFTTCLTAEEVRKHNQFTNRSIEFREEYLDAILENLLPDDIRCLIIAEDEYARCKPLERVFPTPDTHIYLKFIDNPRYYNRLLDAWEHKFGHCKEAGIAFLSRFCEDGYHLHVSDAALEKEPNVALTEIDMLHAKKSDDALTISTNVDNKPNKDEHNTLNVPTMGGVVGSSLSMPVMGSKDTKSIKEHNNTRSLPVKVN